MDGHSIVGPLSRDYDNTDALQVRTHAHTHTHTTWIDMIQTLLPYAKALVINSYELYLWLAFYTAF